MKTNWSLFSILILAILMNFVKVYGKDDAFETEMKEYEGGTVIRKVAVSGKPNEYKVSEFLATGAGTAVYKTDYNGELVSIKVLKIVEGKVNNKHLQSFMRNEQMILDKLKDESKSAEELGYVKLYDYIEDGNLVGKIKKVEKTPDQSRQKSSNSKKDSKSANDGKTTTDSKDKELKTAKLKVMAIVETYFDIDLCDYVNYENYKNPKILQDFDWMRSWILKIVLALWNIHHKGIVHNDVALQNIGVILSTKKVVLFDFGISVVYDPSAQVKDMIYVQNGVPYGMATVLSWEAIMSTATYIRKFADDIISAILSMWGVHGLLAWSGIKWTAKNIEKSRAITYERRFKYNIQNYTNIAKCFPANTLSPHVDKLLQTLYKKVISNPINVGYQDLYDECSKPLKSDN